MWNAPMRRLSAECEASGHPTAPELGALTRPHKPPAGARSPAGGLQDTSATSNRICSPTIWLSGLLEPIHEVEYDLP